MTRGFEELGGGYEVRITEAVEHDVPVVLADRGGMLGLTGAEVDVDSVTSSPRPVSGPAYLVHSDAALLEAYLTGWGRPAPERQQSHDNGEQ